ncbi:MAG: hypothetical protein ACKORF_04660 [Micrococcales bacterium]
MPKLTIDEKALHVGLSAGEKLAALHGNIDVPLSKIAGAEVLGKRWWANLGLRIPGTGLPGVIIAGNFLWRGDRAFVCWTRPNQVLQVNLTNHGYTRLVLGAQDAQEWADKINAYITGC